MSRASFDNAGGGRRSKTPSMSSFFDDSEDLDPAYTDAELANVTRPRRLILTQEQLNATMDEGSKIPRWRTLLKSVYSNKEDAYIPSSSPWKVGSRTGSSKGSSSSNIREGLGSLSDGEGSTELKRSEEISSELDVTRRMDLDDETLEDWWVKQATVAHRRIVLFLAFLAVLTLCHLVFANWLFFKDEVYPNPYLCDSAPCRRVAQNILSKMNESVEPCEDFHLFVCGKEWTESLTNFDPTNDEDWALYNNQILYDYGRSEAVGKLIRSSDPYMLPFHQGCMDRRARNKQHLKPYFDLLERYHLHSTQCKKENCKIEKILAGIYGKNILSKRLFDLRLYYIAGLILVNPKLPQYSKHPAFQYGVETYVSVFKKAIQYVSRMGKSVTNYQTDWGNPDDIEAYAMLFLCADLNLYPFYENGDAGPNIWIRHDSTEKIVEACKYESMSGSFAFTGEFFSLKQPTTTWNDFLHDSNLSSRFPQTPVRPFDYKLYATELLGDYVLNIEELMDNDLDPKYRLLDGLFSNQEMMVRYLQWEILREFESSLDETLGKIFWPITRGDTQCSWLTSCVRSLFKNSPGRATRIFMESIPPETENGVEALMENFHFVINEMMDNFTFASFAAPTSSKSGNASLNSEKDRKATARAFQFAKLVWNQKSTAFDRDRLTNIARLRFHNVHLGGDHFQNVLKTRYRISNFIIGNTAQFETDAYWDKEMNRKATISHPITEHCKSLDDRTTNIVMPLGTFELPYFGTNFPALDIGGVGRFATTLLINQATGNGMFAVVALDHSGFTCPQNIKLDVLEVAQYNLALMKDALKFAKERTPDLWKLKLHNGEVMDFNTLEQDVNNLYSNQLKRQMAVKVAYEVHEKYIRQNETVAKLVLPGLEKYNARQLFFIQSMSRICENEKYSYNKLKHMKVQGPIPASLSINIVAANSKEFSKVFGCKAGSRMNPPDKYNWYKS